MNNAGVAPRERKDLLEATPESFDRVLRINLRGPYFLTQAAARFMVEAGAPAAPGARSIVFITSISATVASVNRGEYCVSKAGLSHGQPLWAARLAEEGISVFEVRPGMIRTDMTAGGGRKLRPAPRGRPRAAAPLGHPRGRGPRRGDARPRATCPTPPAR